jgi:leucyl/phenylalanyl-tRNA---protein transferase
MPVFAITDKLIFPHPDLAEPDGLLGVGGDLSTDRLLLAYSNGIFPWFSEGNTVLWWSPDPRCVLFPDKLHVSKRLARRIRGGNYTVTFDRDFEEVIDRCSAAERKGQDGTWITEDMRKAYVRLHRDGYAHSVEVLMEGELAGGLYGVSLGKVFCGESMFHLRPDASKLALYHLVERLRKWRFPMIDCQVTNPYLLSMGAEEIPRREFLKYLKKYVSKPGHYGMWG